MATEKTVIIIPTYNEELGIEDTLLEVFQTADSILDEDIHVLVFDSASTDNTQNIVKKLQGTYSKLHLQTEPKKSGLGAAYMQAMRYALNTMQADIVIEFDADLSHQPKYFPFVLEKMKTHDVVVGSRYVPGGTVPKNWHWSRKCLSRFGNIIARMLLTRQYKDFSSGFRATRGKALEKALPEKFLSNHYAYKFELFWSLHRTKACILELPIDFVDRCKGTSKLPASSVLDSLKVLFALRLQAVKYALQGYV
jgi:dolichol-phosphate mannosyltransferase